MENFDDDFGAPPPAYVDPAAEFLAKEQVHSSRKELDHVSDCDQCNFPGRAW